LVDAVSLDMRMATAQWKELYVVTFENIYAWALTDFRLRRVGG